jgi:hypothetical protein
MKNILLFGLTALLLISCKKSNIAEYQDYIGVWNSEDNNTSYTFEVKSNGKCFYEEVSVSGNTTKTVNYSGKFILEGSTLKIGIKKMPINKEPELSNGVWHLTMDDIEYTGK